MKKHVIIAGGGTGGHIYPALAIAESLKSQNPGVQISFVGTRGGQEVRLVKDYPLYFLPVGGLNQVGWIQKIMVLVKLPWAFILSLWLLIKIRPQYVLGVGGYASGPFVLLASILGFQTGIFESNAMPGITNRWLSRFVKTSFVLFEESKEHLKSSNIQTTGFPVRGSMELSPKREKENLRVLVFGGSQGARGINITVSQALAQYKEDLSQVEFVHQTGRRDFEKIAPQYKGFSNVQCLEYLDPIKKYYDWADVIFCRAGASTLSELSACGKFAILIPFPYASDNHQQKNAESLVQKNAAQMILQKQFTPEVFKLKIQEIQNHPDQIQRYEEQIHALHKEGAAQYIAKEILNKTKKS